MAEKSALAELVVPDLRYKGAIFTKPDPEKANNLDRQDSESLYRF